MNFPLKRSSSIERHLSLPGFEAQRLKASSRMPPSWSSERAVWAALPCNIWLRQAWAKSESWTTAWWMLPICKAKYSTPTMTSGNPRQRWRPTVCRSSTPSSRSFLSLTRDNAKDSFEEYQLVLDGTDSFDSRYLINDACVLFDKTLIYGAIHQFEGQVSVFNLSNGPTYRCLFPEPPPAGTVPNARRSA